MTRCPRCYEPAPCHRCVAPVRIEAGWVEPLCWLAMVVITVAGVAAVGNPIGWFWL